MSPRSSPGWVIHRASEVEGAAGVTVTHYGPDGEVATTRVPVYRCADCGALLPALANEPGGFIALDARGGWVAPETLDGFPGVRCGR